MSFTALAAFTGLLTLPGVVLLYFLKRKRTELVVPSTLLWRRAINDLRVNSPFQRLRRNLLLLLQLIILTLAVLALAGPVLNIQAARAHKTLLLVDNSGSMRTTDEDRGRASRLEKAKTTAHDLVDQWSDEDEIMLISFHQRARVLQTWTRDRTALHAAIDRIGPTDAETNVGEALRIALGLTASRVDAQRESVNIEDAAPVEEKPAAFANVEVVIISDGAFEQIERTRMAMATAMEQERASQQAPIRYVKVGGASDNVAITALQAARGIGPDSPLRLFVRLKSFRAAPVTFDVELTVDGVLLDLREITLGPGEQSALAIPLPVEEGVARVRLIVDDSLSPDNVAYAVLRTRRQVNVLLVSKAVAGKPRTNYFLERALKLIPSATFAPMSLAQYEVHDVREVHEADAAAEGERLADYDVVIFDGCRPSRLNDGSYLFIGALPPLEGVSELGQAEAPAIVDAALHPVNRAVNYGNVYLRQAIKARWPVQALTLLEGDQGPLITAYGRGRLNVITVAFDLAQTDWPLRISFPLFLANSVHFLAATAFQQSGGARKVGRPIIFPTDPTQSVVELTAPGDRPPVKVKLDPARRARFTDTWQAGLYRARFAGKEKEQDARPVTYAVNVVSPDESDNAAREELTFGSKQVRAQSSSAITSRPVWRWFVLAALAIILLEWYVYHRKTYL